MLCCTLYNRVSEHGNAGDKGPSHSSMAQETSSLNRVTDYKNPGFISGSPATGKSVAGINDLFVDDLFGSGGKELEHLASLRGKETSGLTLKFPDEVVHNNSLTGYVGRPQRTNLLQ